MAEESFEGNQEFQELENSEDLEAMREEAADSLEDDTTFSEGEVEGEQDIEGESPDSDVERQEADSVDKTDDKEGNSKEASVRCEEIRREDVEALARAIERSQGTSQFVSGGEDPEDMDESLYRVQERDDGGFVLDPVHGDGIRADIVTVDEELVEASPRAENFQVPVIRDDSEIQTMAQEAREAFGIPTSSPEDPSRPGGWTVDSRRIDLSRWTESRGSHIMVEALLDRLGSPGAQASVREQLGRTEERFNDLGRPFDSHFVLAVGFRESGEGAFSASPRMINSFGEGGLDYFGQIAPTLIGMRLLPSDFRYEALRGSRQPINELGERVPAALIPQNHLVEAYAARLAPANDAFKQVAREAGFDVEGLDLYVERAWTMAFFAATGSAREILQGLAEERGSLDDIFTSDDLARWDIIRRARVSAAEAYMLDRLLER